MWLSRTQVSERKNDPEPSMDQAILRNCKGAEEMLEVMKEKYDPPMGVRGQNKLNQHEVCGDLSHVMEEDTAKRSNSWKEGIVDHRDTYSLVSPKGDLVNSRSCESLSKCGLRARETELTPEDCSRAGEGTSDPSSSRVAENCTEVEQYEEKKAALGTNAAEGEVGEDLHPPCSKGKDEDDKRLLPSLESPDCAFSMADSQEEFCRQRSCQDCDNEYYDCIEEFLSEGTLVNIDAAGTCVNLETGTVRTTVEVSTVDRNSRMGLKHEVEWVFVRKQK